MNMNNLVASAATLAAYLLILAALFGALGLAIKAIMWVLHLLL